MRDAETLWLLALAFYLFECLGRVPLGAEVVARPFRRWRWQPPWVLRSGSGPALVLAPPTLPSGLLAVGRRDGRHDMAEASQRVASFLAATRYLRALEAALWVMVFGGGALLVWWERLPAEPTFASMGVLWLAVIVEGVRVQRRWTGSGRAPWREVIVALTSPIAAMRLHDVMAKGIAGDLSGLALAAALLPPERLRAVLRPALARARHLGEGDLDVMIGLARQAGLDVVALEAAPTAESAEALSYCPVCEAQYVMASGACASCREVPLIRFGG